MDRKPHLIGRLSDNLDADGGGLGRRLTSIATVGEGFDDEGEQVPRLRNTIAARFLRYR